MLVAYCAQSHNQSSSACLAQCLSSSKSSTPCAARSGLVWAKELELGCRHTPKRVVAGQRADRQTVSTPHAHTAPRPTALTPCLLLASSSSQDGRNIYVVQELCHGGDLADLMTVGSRHQQQSQTLYRSYVSTAHSSCIMQNGRTTQITSLPLAIQHPTAAGKQDHSKATLTVWHALLSLIFHGHLQHTLTFPALCILLLPLSTCCPPACKQAQEGQLSEQEAATIIRCVLEFLADCHERSICYGDVKPNNFVLRSLYPCLAHLMDPRKPRGYLDVVAVDFGCCQEVGEHCLPDAKVMGVGVMGRSGVVGWGKSVPVVCWWWLRCFVWKWWG